MPSRTVLLGSALLASTLAGAMPASAVAINNPTDSAPPAREVTPPAGTFAFVDVSVLPMDRDRVLDRTRP